MALAARIPSALSFRPPVAPELLSCGVPAVDAALGGGLPLGAITELTGAACSGRTTLALSAVAELTRRGESCAYVDATDALDPLSAAAMGADLRRLLWVQAGEADAAVAGSPFPAAAPARIAHVEKFSTGRGGCHPRAQAANMHRAIGELFRPAQYERASNARPEFLCQVPQGIKPVFSPPSTARLKPCPDTSCFFEQTPDKRLRKTPWTALDRALRATDLLLSAGGFRALVLDMGDVPPEQARRVPLATWYRFRLQVEKSRTLFLLLTRVSCANSCAAVSLNCRELAADWQRAAQNSPPLLTGMQYRVSVTRGRGMVDATRRKPAAAAQAALEWSSATSWSR